MIYKKSPPGHIRMFGRTVKPVGLAFCLSLSVLVVLNIFNEDEFGPSLLGDILAVTAGCAALSIFMGWWFRNRRMYEYGLLFACGLWLQRSFFAAFTISWGNRAVWLGICWAILAGGSYYMERTDPSQVKKKNR